MNWKLLDASHNGTNLENLFLKYKNNYYSCQLNTLEEIRNMDS